jgi:hypothetical protein
VLVGRAEAHHPLDARAVVPAAVEQHDLPGSGEVLGVALEVPLRALALRRCGQRDDAADPRVEVLRDAFDGAALARGVAALEHHDEPGAAGAHPLLHLHQLALQAQEFALVRLAGKAAHHPGILAGPRVQWGAFSTPSTRPG